MKSASSGYDKTNKYITKGCKYSEIIIIATRPVAINWKKNKKKIVEMSIINKNIVLNIVNTLVPKIQKKRIVNMETNTIDTTMLEENILNEEDEEDEEDEEEMKTADTVFWNMISRITWYDRDERHMYVYMALNRFTTNEKSYILQQINDIYIPKLKEKLTNVPLLQTVESDNHNNILTHIIMKGKVFYNGILNNPEVSLYLYDQYYPVYDWLRHNIQ
jgi:hypothetical protein